MRTPSRLRKAASKFVSTVKRACYTNFPGNVPFTTTVSIRSLVLSVKKAFNVVSATSLVHLFPPKHHARALRILDDVLAEDPDNIRCLLGRAYTLQYANKWSEAKPLFDKVAALLPDDLVDGLRAQEESAWCTMKSHDPDGAAQALQVVVDVLDSLDGRDSDQARSRWRLGQCHWNMGGEFLGVFSLSCSNLRTTPFYQKQAARRLIAISSKPLNVHPPSLLHSPRLEFIILSAHHLLIPSAHPNASKRLSSLIRVRATRQDA